LPLDFERLPEAHTFDYRGTQGAAYHERRQLPPEAEPWIANVRAEKIQPCVRESDAVFEYGVGFGWNLMALRCARKVGFDVAPGLREVVQRRNIEFVDDLELEPSDAFHVVLCHHTLEHLKNPADALSVMLRLLKQGGRLLLFVPYEKERKYRQYNPNDKAHHLYSWTPSSLSNLVRAQGFAFESVRLRRFRFDRIAAVIARKFRVHERGYRLLRIAGLCALPEYEIALVARKLLPFESLTQLTPRSL
jgi:SAM-dependent methyltransferase